MTIKKIDMREAVNAERFDDVADHREQRGWTKRDRPRKAKMMLSHADGQSRTDQNVHSLAQLLRDRRGTNRVCADQTVGAVLLGGTNGHNDRG